jgi:ribonuclease D
LFDASLIHPRPGIALAHWRQELHRRNLRGMCSARAIPLLPEGIQPAISRETMAALPIRRYDGPVCLVTTRTELNAALADIQQETVVGFDTETRPAFRKGVRYLPSLVLVATARSVYLFQLRRVDVIPGLADMLTSPAIVKAGVAVARDLQELKEVFAVAEKNVVDLGVIGRRHGLQQSGVRNLAGIFLGCRVTKAARTTNWAAATLSPAQIAYAATDAWISRELYLRFQSLGLR